MLFRSYVPKTLDKDLLDEALVREVVREVQSMRKKNGFKVTEAINLTINSSEEINAILKKAVKILQKEVGAKEVIVGKTVGRHKGKVDFNGKKIDVAFDKM